MIGLSKQHKGILQLQRRNNGLLRELQPWILSHTTQVILSSQLLNVDTITAIVRVVQYMDLYSHTCRSYDKGHCQVSTCPCLWKIVLLCVHVITQSPHNLAVYHSEKSAPGSFPISPSATFLLEHASAVIKIYIHLLATGSADRRLVASGDLSGSCSCDVLLLLLFLSTIVLESPRSVILSAQLNSC